jgi:hypothetical protein
MAAAEVWWRGLSFMMTGRKTYGDRVLPLMPDAMD